MRTMWVIFAFAAVFGFLYAVVQAFRWLVGF
jgi:hypothetical protein